MGEILEAERPEVRVAAQMTGAVARGRDVSLKTAAGAVTGLVGSEDTRGYVLTKTGSGPGQARSDGAMKLGGSDIESGKGGEWISGVVQTTDETYRQASRWRQEAC